MEGNNNKNFELGNKCLTSDEIVEKLDVTAENAITGADILVTISDADVEKVNTLRAGESTTIMINTNVNGVITSKSVDITIKKHKITIEKVFKDNSNSEKPKSKVETNKEGNLAGYNDDIVVTVKKSPREDIVSVDIINEKGENISTSLNPSMDFLNGIYKFNMPNQDVRIKITFKKINYILI